MESASSEDQQKATTTFPDEFRTRFAPTPSGRLHRGNGLSFLVTWCLARAAGGRIVLRIDDLDKQRRRREYLEDIFYTLDWLGLDYDEGPAGVEDFLKHYSQHHRLDRYQEALEMLRQKGGLFACTCTRSQIRRRSTTGLYPGICRERRLPFEAERTAWRIRVSEETQVAFREWRRSDPVIIRLAEFMGDFVVRQKNRMPAYQIASLIDDLDYHINFVVRGQDLMISSAAQTHLAQRLGAASFSGVTFWHHPLLLDPSGEKLSKSEGAEALSSWREAGRDSRSLWRTAAAWLGLPADTGADPEGLAAACRERYFR